MNDKTKAFPPLITGATGGMGRALALPAASRGYDLILSDLHDDKLKSLADACSQRGIRGGCHTRDASDSAAIASFTEQIKSGADLDAFIHRVGFSPQVNAWENIVELDLIGTVELLKANNRAIKPGGCGACISSMSVYIIPPNSNVDKLVAAPLPNNADSVDEASGWPNSHVMLEAKCDSI